MTRILPSTVLVLALSAPAVAHASQWWTFSSDGTCVLTSETTIGLDDEKILSPAEAVEKYDGVNLTDKGDAVTVDAPAYPGATAIVHEWWRFYRTKEACVTDGLRLQKIEDEENARLDASIAKKDAERKAKAEAVARALDPYR